MPRDSQPQDKAPEGQGAPPPDTAHSPGEVPLLHGAVLRDWKERRVLESHLNPVFSGATECRLTPWEQGLRCCGLAAWQEGAGSGGWVTPIGQAWCP